MKLKYSLYIILTVFLTSCGGHNATVKTSFYENRVEFPFYKSLNRTDKYFSYINFEYPDSIINADNGGMAAVEKMRKKLLEELLGEEYVRQNYDGDVKGILDLHERECRKELRRHTVEVYNSGNFRNWATFLIYEFEDGLYEREKGLCFDLRDGEIADEEDLFEKGGKEHLSRMLESKIRESRAQAEISGKETEDAVSKRNFIFRGNSILFLFPAGSIAPESEGPVRVGLSLNDIGDYLR